MVAFSAIYADDFIPTTEEKVYSVIKASIKYFNASYVDKLWFPGEYTFESSIGQASRLSPGYYYNLNLLAGYLSINIYAIIPSRINLRIYNLY